MDNNKYTFKEFMMKVFGGVSIAIIAGLITNAILGEVFSALKDKGSIFEFLLLVVNMSQMVVPALVGALIAKEFDFDLVEISVVTTTTFLASGSIKPVDGGYIIAGIGDLINTILVASLAVFVVLKLRGKFGSLNILLLPLVVVTFVGAIGLFTLPYVSQLTAAIGLLVEKITTLQPLLMSILLAITFGILIISPFSTVAVGLAIGLTGLGSGAANIGICATTAVVVIGSMKVNKSGITLAALLASPKIFLKNWIANPKLNIPIVITAGISGIFAYIFNIQGTAQSAGFGLAGLVGPINAISLSQNGLGQAIILAALAFVIIPFITSIIVHKLLVGVLKIYDYDIFKFGEDK
ncbi:MAG: PTS sugar transporter subunit IIC [Anaerococcus sp.]|nr:PTS sugar transporter subunit IIC [Anaerococcus sp.]